MTRKILIFQLLFFLNLSTWAQLKGNFRFREIQVKSDTILVDTLSIIPGSLIVRTADGSILNQALYKFNYAASQFIMAKTDSSHITLHFSYRVYPISFSKTWYNKDEQLLLSSDSLMGASAYRYSAGNFAEKPFGDKMNVTGSIERGFSIGNNQDLVVSSGLNLQLNGELGNGIKLEGAITDRSIPFQAQGNTLRFEEFDRVFIRAYTNDFEVQAGDITVNPLKPGLLVFGRNVQGLSFYYHQGIANNDTITVKSAVAVAKGKFARNYIQGIEKNQGPYKLIGAEGETFIVVISGSEKVFLDGELLSRGEANHYTIEYNTAEITFTPKIIIKSNSRINVEFEYTERSYTRYITAADVEQRKGDFRIKTSFFSESDSKSQPLDANLTSEQISLLSSIGDDLNSALSPQADFVKYQPDKILYYKKDTLVNGITYSIYIHSTDSLNARYQLEFSYLGEGNGSYIQVFGKTNGRVFKWVAPENGKMKGGYEPVKQLVTPKKKQMISLSISKDLKRNGLLNAELAINRNDLNTFSPIDDKDNFGSAVKVDYKDYFNNDTSASTWLELSSLITSTNFRYIDRYRPVEFERDWNLSSALSGGNEKNAAFSFGHQKGGNIIVGESEFLHIGSDYKGFKYGLRSNVVHKKYRNKLNISNLNSADTLIKTNFFRGKENLRVDFNKISLELDLESELNDQKRIESGLLFPNSYRWYQAAVKTGLPDSLPFKLNVLYSFRNDFKALGGEMEAYSQAQDFGVAYEKQGKQSSYSFYAGYRFFVPTDTSVSNTLKKEELALCRLNYSYSLPNGFISTNINYELGSGLEPKYYYYYVEVPAGQGIFTWVDYNSNGIKEVDEFEIASFRDEARFIRINLPSNQYISVNTSMANIFFDVNPVAIFSDSTYFHRFISKITDRISMGGQQKNRSHDLLYKTNPFNQHVYDSLMVRTSQNIINSLAFNRYSSIFRLEWMFNQNLNKQILANGFEISKQTTNQLIIWGGLSSTTSIMLKYTDEVKKQESEFFKAKNYELNRRIPYLKLRFNSGYAFTIEGGFEYEDTRNIGSTEILRRQTIFADLNLSLLNKIWLGFKGNLSKLEYKGALGTPIEYELLKGFKPGTNSTWEMNMRRKISSYFEVEFSYSGRYLSTGKIINVGNFQVRAVF